MARPLLDSAPDHTRGIELLGFRTQNGSIHADPLADHETAEQFARSLPLDDPLKTLRALSKALSTLANKPAPDVEQLGVLLTLDLRTERLCEELLHNSVERGLRSWPPENTVWQALLELAGAFGRAYAHFLRQARERSTNRVWLEGAPRLLIQFFRHWQVENLLSVFRYEQLAPARWRELHEAYLFGRSLRVTKTSAAGLDRRKRAADGTLEREYLQILLLQLMNNGEFTPREVFWARQRIAPWSTEVSLKPGDEDDGRGSGDERFVVDLAGTEGLQRPPVEPAKTLLYLDLNPILVEIDEELRTLRNPAGIEHGATPDVRPVLRSLLPKLKTLFSSKPVRMEWRGERESIDLLTAHVVAGLAPIVRSLHEEWQQAQVTARSPVPEVEEITITDVGGSWRATADPARSEAKAITLPAMADTEPAEQAWRIRNCSESGTLLRGRVDDPYRVTPGALVAFREANGGQWTVAVVRRLKRIMRSNVEIGVEHIGYNPQGVTIAVPVEREFPAAESAGEMRQRFSALFLRGSAQHPTVPLKTLLLPAREFKPGRHLTLLSTTMSYTLRLKEPLEPQVDFVWTAFEIIAKQPQESRIAAS